jgi:hypothetical protein
MGWARRVAGVHWKYSGSDRDVVAGAEARSGGILKRRVALQAPARQPVAANILELKGLTADGGCDFPRMLKESNGTAS